MQIVLLNLLANAKDWNPNSFDAIFMIEDWKVSKLTTVRYIEDWLIKTFLKPNVLNQSLNAWESLEEFFVRIWSFSTYSDFKIERIWVKPWEYLKGVYRPLLIEYNPREYEDGEDIHDSLMIKVIRKFYEWMTYNVPIDIEKAITSIRQLGVLKSLLKKLFETVDAYWPNLESYGHNIANLLVLACIEVEVQRKEVYWIHANTVSDRLTTAHYVKLKMPFRLHEYIVDLPFYPWLQSIKPFENRDISTPTQSIEWYDAYNEIKHNRWANFNKANLKNAISAVCAVAILIKVQYGTRLPYRGEEVGWFFKISDIQRANEDKIVPPVQGLSRTSKILWI